MILTSSFSTKDQNPTPSLLNFNPPIHPTHPRIADDPRSFARSVLVVCEEPRGERESASSIENDGGWLRVGTRWVGRRGEVSSWGSEGKEERVGELVREGKRERIETKWAGKREGRTCEEWIIIDESVDSDEDTVVHSTESAKKEGGGKGQLVPSRAHPFLPSSFPSALPFPPPSSLHLPPTSKV